MFGHFSILRMKELTISLKITLSAFRIFIVITGYHDAFLLSFSMQYFFLITKPEVCGNLIYDEIHFHQIHLFLDI